MDNQLAQQDDQELQTQLILLASSHHDLEALRPLLRSSTGSANVQDPETGFTPLHAAIAACEDADDTEDQPAPNDMPLTNGTGAAELTQEPPMSEKAAKTVKYLLQNGAIWNDVDRKDETPGCLALRLGLTELYDIMVDAGVRAEMLLSRLDEYQRLEDDEDEDVSNETQVVVTEPPPSDSATAEINNETSNPSSSHDATPSNGPQSTFFLRSTLHFRQTDILDDQGNGVMMAWEKDIMRRSADYLAPTPGLRILNIGHGMGIIDEFFQSKEPSIHHIIEPHPDVIARMRENGWLDKPGVVVHEGRWQDVVPRIISQEILFDTVYFDTFAEDYKALRDFFSDCLVGILDDSGRWGFFNGMGADRQICYDVYGKIVEMDLFEAGYEVEWDVVKVPEMSEEEWEGVRRRYWALREYRLPVCRISC